MMRSLVYWRPTWWRRAVVVLAAVPALIASLLVGAFCGAREWVGDMAGGLVVAWKGKQKR